MTNTSLQIGLTARVKKLIRNFSDDSGATTVEFVLWVPVFMFILMITVDVSLLFLRQSNLWYVARDVARQASIRQITDIDVLKERAETQGTFGGDRPSAAGSEITAQTVTVVLRVKMVKVGIFGILNIGGRAINVGNEGDLIAYVTQRLEPI
ncbi:MAG: TadE family protein [Paracoccaceae bacterium]|jgi:Flp pilus assembly protein TadG